MNEEIEVEITKQTLIVKSVERDHNQITIIFTNGKKIVIDAITAGDWECDLFVTKLIPA